MVEVLVELEPLASGFVLTRVLKGGIDGREVLGAAHGGDPFLGWLINWVVEETKTGGVPSLTNLGVDFIGAVEVGIDTLEDSNIDRVLVGLDGVVEDNLKVGVVRLILRYDVSR